MDKPTLLSKLTAQKEQFPSVTAIANRDNDVNEWIYATKHLLENMRLGEGAIFASYLNRIISISNSNNDLNYKKARGLIHDVIAELELELESVAPTSYVYSANQPYSYYIDLNKILCKAESSLMIIDPHVSDVTIDEFVKPIARKNIAINIMYSKDHNNAVVAGEKLKAEYNLTNFCMAKSSAIHDRLIIIDGGEVWTSSGSLKDAAVKKPSMLIKLADDVSELKKDIYYELWDKAISKM